VRGISKRRPTGTVIRYEGFLPGAAELRGLISEKGTGGMLLVCTQGVGEGVGFGVGLAFGVPEAFGMMVAVAFGVTVGLGVGFGVALGVGFGVGVLSKLLSMSGAGSFAAKPLSSAGLAVGVAGGLRQVQETSGSEGVGVGLGNAVSAEGVAVEPGVAIPFFLELRQALIPVKTITTAKPAQIFFIEPP
jgi:hypothetical protein